MTATSRRHARHAWILAGVVTLFAAAPTSTSAVSDPARLGQAATAVRLELVAQRFAVDPNGDIRLSYVLSGLDGDPLELVPPPPVVPAPPEADPAAPTTGDPVVPPAPVPDPSSNQRPSIQADAQAWACRRRTSQASSSGLYSCTE